MSQSDVEQIVESARKIERATAATLADINPWVSWNFRVTQAREFGEQIIALAGLVAELAQQVERLSSEGAISHPQEEMS